MESVRACGTFHQINRATQNSDHWFFHAWQIIEHAVTDGSWILKTRTVEAKISHKTRPTFQQIAKIACLTNFQAPPVSASVRELGRVIHAHDHYPSTSLLTVTECNNAKRLIVEGARD